MQSYRHADTCRAVKVKTWRFDSGLVHAEILRYTTDFGAVSSVAEAVFGITYCFRGNQLGKLCNYFFEVNVFCEICLSNRKR